MFPYVRHASNIMHVAEVSQKSQHSYSYRAQVIEVQVADPIRCTSWGVLQVIDDGFCLCFCERFLCRVYGMGGLD